MKITNPYSKNRFKKIEKIDRKATAFVKPLLRKYINTLDDETLDISKHPKYILKSFHQVAYHIKNYEEYEKNKQPLILNSQPFDIDIKLNCIFISDLIVVENLYNFKKGIKKIFDKINLKSSSLIYYDPDNVNNFCDSVEKNINGGTWSNLGYLKIDETHKLYEFAKTIEVYATHLSSSFIILGLNIYPSENFLKIFNNILETSYPPDDIIQIRPKNFTTYWKHTTFSDTSKKEREIEDLKLELKWNVLKYFNRYFKLYLSSQKIIVPSIESYELDKDKCDIEEKFTTNNFFSSLKMNSWDKEISKDGYWEIYYDTRESIDLSLKVTCNSLLSSNKFFGNLEREIIHKVNEYGKIILPVLVINSYLSNLSFKLANERKNTFKYLNNKKIKHKKIIDARFKLEKEIQILKRLNNEFNDSTFESILYKVSSILGEYEKTFLRIKESNSESIVSQTSDLLSSVTKYSSDFANILDDRIQLLEIQTNNSLRKRSYAIAIFSAFITLIAMILAVLSLYVSIVGLSDSKKDGALEFLENIISILF